jgi:hypothetical protein
MADETTKRPPSLSRGEARRMLALMEYARDTMPETFDPELRTFGAWTFVESWLQAVDAPITSKLQRAERLIKRLERESGR